MARIFFKSGWTSDTHDRRRVFHAANYFIAGAKTYRVLDRGALPIVTGCGRWRRATTTGTRPRKSWLRKAWRILKRIRKIAGYV